MRGKCVYSQSQWWWGPLGLVTASWNVLWLSSNLREKHTMMVCSIRCFLYKEIFLWKPWPEISASGGRELILALRAFCINPRASVLPFSSSPRASVLPYSSSPTPCPLQFSSFGSWPWADLSSNCPIISWLWGLGQVPCIPCASVRESNTLEYHQEVNDIAEIKTLAPDFQTNNPDC